MLYGTSAHLPQKKKKRERVSQKNNGDRREIYQELKLYVVDLHLLK